ncbi:phosphoglycolate phosphatase [Citrobacter portucalensis]|uniref:phosphoglycolate phosphatase n=1 Tax=Citrobacter portucalensis TaxID=1639133 RepID=UPI00242AADDE|nr:phosphoglycolate phosphatase [Citrobacter portucalensis]WFZ22196.1 phosphoglycolate phosphatase [Citrobacter portucalensis]
MDSWAENDISYPSLNADTPNKEEPPAEMQASGFVPTYMDKGGNLVIGDPLTAQHMNYLLCDLYRKYTAALARIETLEGGQ